MTVHGRFFQNAEFPDARKTHVQRPGDRRCGQCQNIDIPLQFLQLFLVLHAEALLFIDDQESQRLGLDIFRKNAVRPDDDIHQSLREILQCLPLLRRAPETAEEADADGEIRHALDKGIVVLLRQDRGGHQVDDLTALLHSLERRAEGDLRLSVSHVTADQPVHDPPLFHVRFDVLDGLQLVLRLLEGEHFLEFLLPDCIRAVFMTFQIHAGGIQGDQFLRDLRHRALHAAPGPAPLRTAQAAQLRGGSVARGVFLYNVELRRRDIAVVAPAVLDLHEVPDHAVGFDLLDTAVDSEAVVLVDHIIADGQLRKRGDGASFIRTLLSAPLLLPAFPEQVLLREDREADQGILEAAVQITADHHDGALCRCRRSRFARTSSRRSGLASRGCRPFRIAVRAVGGKLIIPEALGESSGSGAGLGQKDDPPALLPVAPEILQKQFKAPREGGGRLGSRGIGR